MIVIKCICCCYRDGYKSIVKHSWKRDDEQNDVANVYVVGYALFDVLLFMFDVCIDKTASKIGI